MQQIFGGVTGDKFYTVTFKEDGARRKLCPYKMKNYIASKLNGKPRSITSSGRNGVLIEVNTEEQGRNIKQLECVLDREVETKMHTFFNEVRGIIYIRNSDIADLEAFQEGMQERYPVVGIERANFVKPRDPQTRAFVVKFRGDACPEYVKIPG